MRTLLLVAMLALGIGSSARAADPAKLAALIDSRISERFRSPKDKPAPLTDDATFLRRASLDLIGRIPTASEVREFLADKSTDKRSKLVAKLTESGGHTRHMATFWRRTWVPQADTPEFARLIDDFEAWVAVRLQEKQPYDRMVRELLTLSDTRLSRSQVSPAGFFAASEGKPENLAASATRAFLGVNLDCAQCHDHPFARWTRDQFWQTAAFFAPPTPGKDGKAMPASVMIPNTKKSLMPELLDGGQVSWPESLTENTGRTLLANWLVAKENPYFARNAVNRLWAEMFGTALVEPLDDLSGEGSNTGPAAELLTELATAFTESGFDLGYLTRAMVLTTTYQRSAIATDTATDPKTFARMPIRGLTGEQLYDSLRTAAGLPVERTDTGRGLTSEPRRRFTSQFLVARTVQAERSISQSLTMLNGRLTNDLTDPDKNPTIAGVINAPFLDTAGKVQTLFLATLGREPTARELKTMTAHVEQASEADRGRALGDIFWALVNSTEFNTNY